MSIAQKTRPTTREATREDVRNGLVKCGLPPETAEYWCDQWLRHAAWQGVARERHYFWDAATGWIDAQRTATRPLR